MMDRYEPLDEMQRKHGDDIRTCGDCMAEESVWDDLEQWHGWGTSDHWAGQLEGWKY